MTDKPLIIELPWPPSDNRLTRHAEIPAGKGLVPCHACGHRRSRVVAFPSDEAKEYQHAVEMVLLEKNLSRLTGPLCMDVDLYPPDRRKIDGANRLKALQDAIKRREIGRRKKGEKPRWDPKQIAWLFATDDSQVVEGSWKLCNTFPGGKVVVRFTHVAGQGELFDMAESQESEA